ncbi:AMP-binding protein, partial [Arthrospira platensis SPKY1]|nr:AMP-binding protein [Arthrospira platensis SPKY1]
MKKITRLFDIPYYQKEKFNTAEAFVTKYNGKWVSTSSQEYIIKAIQVSKALMALGIQKNDKIAIISTNNRTEWNIMDIGILQTGAQSVPMYPTISEEDYAYILNHSEAVFCFVSDAEIFNKLQRVRNQIPSLKEIYCF